MELRDTSIVITGGASGIGAALARAAQDKGARIAIADQDAQAVMQRADQLGCFGYHCDVTIETDVQRLVSQATDALGEIDIFVSNAGIFAGQPDHVASASDAVWMRNWAVHVMAQVYAARALVPGMLRRGSGYFVTVASAAGLLNQIGDAAYSTSKHAAVSFAESLAIRHGADGIGVSVACPQYVATPLLGLNTAASRTRPALLTAEEVAHSIISGVEKRQFLILPHPEVARYAQQRAADHGRWIEGMRRLQQKSISQLGPAEMAQLYRLD